MYLFHHHLLHTTTPMPTCAHNRDTLTARAAAASYLAQKPPEFWKPKDWLDSRRLRALREWELWKAARRFRHHYYKRVDSDDEAATAAAAIYAQAQAQPRVVQRYPEGPFWPRTPTHDAAWREEVREWRALEAVVERLWRAGFEVYEAPDGEVVVRDPSTGEMGPVGMFLPV